MMLETLLYVCRSIKFFFLKILGPKSQWEYEQEQTLIDHMIFIKDSPELLSALYERSAEIDKEIIIANLLRVSEFSQQAILRTAARVSAGVNLKNQTTDRCLEVGGRDEKMYELSVGNGITVTAAAVTNSTVMTKDSDFCNADCELDDIYIEAQKEYDIDKVFINEDGKDCDDYGKPERVNIEFEELERPEPVESVSKSERSSYASNFEYEISLNSSSSSDYGSSSHSLYDRSSF
jgi:hypothetical protein